MEDFTPRTQEQRMWVYQLKLQEEQLKILEEINNKLDLLFRPQMIIEAPVEEQIEEVKQTRRKKKEVK